MFDGLPGHAYTFYSVATDGAGNETESAPVTTTFADLGGAKQTFTDDDGDSYTLKLTGPGQMQFLPDDPDLNGEGPIGLVRLTGTDPAKSTLSIAVKTAPSGDGRVGINRIQGSGLKSISAAASNLVGTVDLTGLLGGLTIHDVKAGATVHALGSSSQKTTISAHVVVDNVAFNLGSSIASFKAAAVGKSTIIVPSMRSLSVKGDARYKPAPIRGDFNADLTLTGDPTQSKSLSSATIAGNVSAATWNVTGDVGSMTVSGTVTGLNLTATGLMKKLKLGKVADATMVVHGAINSVKAIEWSAGRLKAGSIGTLTVSGNLGADLTVTGAGGYPAIGSATVSGVVSGSTIQVNGTVRSFTAGRFVDSNLFVGFTPDSADPFTGGSFLPGATLSNFRATGLKNSTDPAFVNSFVVADWIGRVSLKSVAADNHGTPFGLRAGQVIEKVTITTPAVTLKNVLTDPTLPPVLGDFDVLVT
jgi:hypothetical protein